MRSYEEIKNLPMNQLTKEETDWLYKILTGKQIEKTPVCCGIRIPKTEVINIDNKEKSSFKRIFMKRLREMVFDKPSSQSHKIDKENF